MNSYNIKWGILYVLYILMYVEFTVPYLNYSDPWDFFFYDGLEDIIIWPFLIYLLFPIFLKHCGHWKVVRWLDTHIDYLYQLHKALNTKEN